MSNLRLVKIEGKQYTAYLGKDQQAHVIVEEPMSPQWVEYFRAVPEKFMAAMEEPPEAA